MAAIAERLELGPDEFAFHFETDGGVDAGALAGFLKHAATVARQRGAELRVVGLRDGSLDVVIQALRKGARKEFLDKPIDTTIKASTFLAGVVGAIVLAMSPERSGETPLGKAGAEVVEKHGVAQIWVVTNDHTTVVMNPVIAKAVRESVRNDRLSFPPAEEVRRLPVAVAAMLEDARTGDLTGDAAIVEGELHFRPDGYRFWVPVDENPVTANGSLSPGRRFKVTGRIATLEGQPDRIVVDGAEPIR